MRPLRESSKKVKVKRQTKRLLTNCFRLSYSLVRSSFYVFTFSFLLSLFPSAFKELRHQLATLVFKNSANHFYPMIKLIRAADAKVRINRAGFFISRAVNQKRHARLNQRSGAHRARLNRRVNNCAGQAIVANLQRGLAQS